MILVDVLHLQCIYIYIYDNNNNSKNISQLEPLIIECAKLCQKFSIDKLSTINIQLKATTVYIYNK